MKIQLPVIITREGIFIVALTILFGLSAANTGTNLLYLLFAMMLSLLIASGVLTTLNLRHLEIERQVPDYGCVGDKLEVVFEVENEKKRFTSFALEIEDNCKEGHYEGEVVAFLVTVAARDRATTSYEITPRKRGRIHFSYFRIKTRFPFGIFGKSRRRKEEGEIPVYPAVYHLRQERERGGEESTVSSLPQRRKSSRGEFRSLRDYQPGDPLRFIHWKSSARHGHLVVREHDPPSPQSILIFLSLQGASEMKGEEVEDIISGAASLAIYYLKKDFEVGLVTSDARQSYEVEVGRGKDKMHEILKTLALLNWNGIIQNWSWPSDSRQKSGEWQIGIFCQVQAPSPPLDHRFDGKALEDMIDFDHPRHHPI